MLPGKSCQRGNKIRRIPPFYRSREAITIWTDMILVNTGGRKYTGEGHEEKKEKRQGIKQPCLFNVVIKIWRSQGPSGGNVSVINPRQTRCSTYPPWSIQPFARPLIFALSSFFFQPLPLENSRDYVSCVCLPQSVDQLQNVFSPACLKPLTKRS